MKHQHAKRSTDVFRQQVRYALFTSKFAELKATDFDGEPVVIRDSQGKPLIRRRSRQALRSMAREYTKRQWKLGREAQAAREKDFDY